jgi:DNA polymerase-3 subunit epsilon
MAAIDHPIETLSAALPRPSSHSDAAHALQPVLPRDLVFVDLETTGCNASYHRIIEIGIVRVRDGVRIEEWSSLVNPEHPIPAATAGFTGITDEMVSSAPTFRELAAQVREKLAPRSGEAPPWFVAHNARFDYAFLRAEFRRLEQPFIAPVLCTVKLSRRLFPEHVSHNLDALMERHALECTARHRALGDAQVLADFWSRLTGEVPRETLLEAAEAIVHAHRLPAHLPEGLEEELPDGPGAYRLYGENDVLLYVGRSRTLRTRILAHFPAPGAPGAPGAPRAPTLAQEVRRIEWEETAGELGAALRELDWIESGRPLRNRRRSVEEVTLRFGEADAPTQAGRPEVVPLRELEPGELEHCYGTFQHPSDARRALTEIARAHELCLKLLGLEDGEGSCFAHAMGRCKGACLGREPVALHALRVRLALAGLKLKPWPFAGRVALIERDAQGQSELHVVERWVYLGTARSEEELEGLRVAPVPAFDAHRYRVLVRHLAQHPNLEWRALERDRP